MALKTLLKNSAALVLYLDDNATPLSPYTDATTPLGTTLHQGRVAVVAASQHFGSAGALWKS
jgi:hypothetical protein